MGASLPPEEPPSFLRGVAEILFWVVIVTAGIMVFGSAFTTAGVVLKIVAFGVAALVGLMGWFTDLIEPPRGRLTTTRRGPPRRKRKIPKGQASRKRR